MAYLNFLKTLKSPVTFVAKMPRKDFVVLVVVIGIVAALIAGVIVNKNKVEIAETFSNLAVSVVKACDSYPEITGNKVYAKENCGCLECTNASYGDVKAPVVIGPVANELVKENFGRMNMKKVLQRKNNDHNISR